MRQQLCRAILALEGALSTLDETVIPEVVNAEVCCTNAERGDLTLDLDDIHKRLADLLGELRAQRRNLVDAARVAA